jgi:ABC-type uncharacterized transport system YnjBCD ATPase subunit
MATEDVAAWFAGFSAIASIIACVIAYDARKAADRSADSAERANDINLHQSRLDIYKAFQNFHGTLVQRGTQFDESAVWPFLSKANLSEFYFDANLHVRLTAAAKEALEIVSKAEEIEFLRKLPEKMDRATLTNLRAVLNKKHRVLRAECASLDEALRAELRLFNRHVPATGQH